MVSVAILIGGALANALAFTGSSYWFHRQSADNIDAALKLIPISSDNLRILYNLSSLTNLLSWVELTRTDILIGGLPILYTCQKTPYFGTIL